MMATSIAVPATGTTEKLASFLSDLRFEDLPLTVVQRTEDLFLDWIASALAGKDARPVRILEWFAESMGPSDGSAETLASRRRTSPFFAALVNGAASHVAEQDDVHNAAVFHPGAVVFPAALAAAQDIGATGRDLIVAAVAGYEAGVRAGASLGRSHYRVFHTTGTVGPLASAAAVAHLLGADRSVMLHALGSAGTQAAGLWEFLRDAADSKQLHAAKAAGDGLLAAYLAQGGFTGAKQIIEGHQGMAAGMSSDANMDKLTEGLGTRWAVLETSFKVHACCRHIHPAADALLGAIERHDLTPERITRVRAHVHQAALEVLGPVTDPQTIHQAKFSMGFALALIALRGHAGLADFSDETLADPAIRQWLGRVEMVFDPEIDASYPDRWIGLIEVETDDGERLTSRVDVPRGDPENSLSRAEIEQKALHLAAYRAGASRDEMRSIIDRVWALDEQPNVRSLLPRG